MLGVKMREKVRAGGGGSKGRGCGGMELLYFA